MSESNKSYRIRTNVGSEYNGELKFNVNLLQDYDEFEILSLKIGTESLYKYHTSKYGCIVGRVLANGGVGVPNVKISSFIPVEDIDAADPVFSFLYPYTSTRDKNRDEIRYNLLTDTKIDDCHQVIGTFPNKRLVLDDNNVIEIYDKYYKFTTTTNGSGDYMLFGLPTGNNIIHSDLDLSDIGFLSQKPRDLFYKGYTAKQFENASQFKKDTNLDNLTQVISQDSSVYVFPFWGDEIENEGQIKIVRNDIDVNYKFEPTCIFIGCIVSDEKSNAISKNCIPHERMGKMDRLTTGAGTIEMIRKTISGDIESISIQGNNLIDGNGTWCYQIPMNLDYMATDEYGNLVPTDDYNKGLPTRTTVRFRVSLADYESDYENAHLVKVLVPNNPDIAYSGDTKYVDYDYEFGSATQDESFRDMFWNNVYTVKSYIPRFQKGNRQRNKNFTGFKAVNVNGANNPIPYNNMRINLTFLFVFQCLIFKSLVLIIKTLNKIIYVLDQITCGGGCGSSTFKCGGQDGIVYLTLDGGMCPTLDGNYIAPGAENFNKYHTVTHTYKNVYGEEYKVYPKVEIQAENASQDTNVPNVAGETALPYDKKSADAKNSDLLDTGKDGVISTAYTNDDVSMIDPEETSTMKIFNTEDYFVKCVELQFAMEYEVIQFDFYNDWINGMIYIPRWFAEIRKNKDKAYYCGDTFVRNRLLTQQCAVSYDSSGTINSDFNVGCRKGKQHCHKRWGRRQVKIFGINRGIVTAQKNSRGQYAYYLRPNELTIRSDNKKIKANLFPTDIVLLGSVLDCNQYGIPKVNGYTSSSYKMPPPTAEIISDTQEMQFQTEFTDEYISKTAISNAISVANSEFYSKIVTILNGKYTITETDLEKEKYKTYITDITTNDEGNRVTNLTYNEVLFFANEILKDKKINITDILTNFNELCKGYNTAQECDCQDITKVIYDKIIGNIKDIIIEKIGTIDSYTDYKCLKDLRSAINDADYSDILSKIDTAYKNVKDVKEKLRDENDHNVTDWFYSFDKKSVMDSQLDDEEEATYSELSGIDWGYNPFETGSNDNTTFMEKQIAGHFLEIGCTFSLSNIKSCVNLQRVCEIGGEISQSHYYYNPVLRTWNLLDPTGIIAKREVIDAGIRGTFATLNSQKLGIMYDTSNGYKKYTFTPYNPVSFMGDLKNRDEISGLISVTTKTPGYAMYNNYGLIENQSLSYRAFRFATTGSTLSDKFLVYSNGGYFMPQYENSFYFYFGLRDGNTAIDRLYNEYYAPCSVNSDIAEVTFTVTGHKNEGFDLHYNTQNMSKIKSITVKWSGHAVDFTWDKKKSIITVPYIGKYTIRMKDTSNQVVKSIVVCSEQDYENGTVVDKKLLFRRYLTNYNKWKFYYKPINCDVTYVRIDGNGYSPNNNRIIDDWYELGNGNFVLEFEPNSTHAIEFKSGDIVLYNDTVVLNEDVLITNIDCNTEPCTITYTQTNIEIGVIDSSAVGNIDYANKTFSINKNENNTVLFKNDNESVVIERIISTINEDAEDPDDGYDIKLKLDVYNSPNIKYTITYEIASSFIPNEIYVNNSRVEFYSFDEGISGSFDTRHTGINEIIFENTEGVRVRRIINTNVNVAINNVTYNADYCDVTYEETGFVASSINSNILYDDCQPLGGVFDINTNNKTFKVKNGYNDQNQTQVYLRFKNEDESIGVSTEIETNPTQTCKTCPYDPSDA